jgi:hypothetical protein
VEKLAKSIAKMCNCAGIVGAMVKSFGGSAGNSAGHMACIGKSCWKYVASCTKLLMNAPARLAIGCCSRWPIRG